jgi:hypothetical protein
MAGQKVGGPPKSPWTYESADYLGRAITFTVNFNEQTLDITSARIDRDPGCMYTKIFLGIGGDGSPNSSTRQFSVGQSTGHPVAQAELAAAGISTFTDLIQVQVTASP